MRTHLSAGRSSATSLWSDLAHATGPKCLQAKARHPRPVRHLTGRAKRALLCGHSEASFGSDLT